MKIRKLENLNEYKNQQLSRNNGYIEHLNIEKIKKYLPSNTSSYILDVGCRSGQTIQNLISLGYKNAYGMDLGDTTWDKMSESIRSNFIKHDIHDGIPMDNKFDFISCSHMFEHVYDPIKILEIFKSKLKENGVLYISVPLDFLYKGMNHTPHYTFFESENDLKSFLEKNGFSILEISTNQNGPGGMSEVISFSKSKIIL
jgi:2-polyprenyl-3-methyl-5-hydroxy-6-metoxy-1,4-benzoquinol methylase